MAEPRPCVMCYGKGTDFDTVVSEPDEIGTVTVLARVTADRPCRACRGTGVEDV